MPSRGPSGCGRCWPGCPRRKRRWSRAIAGSCPAAARWRRRSSTRSTARSCRCWGGAAITWSGAVPGPSAATPSTRSACTRPGRARSATTWWPPACSARPAARSPSNRPAWWPRRWTFRPSRPSASFAASTSSAGSTPTSGGWRRWSRARSAPPSGWARSSRSAAGWPAAHRRPGSLPRWAPCCTRWGRIAPGSCRTWPPFTFPIAWTACKRFGVSPFGPPRWLRWPSGCCW